MPEHSEHIADETYLAQVQGRLLDAALPHVPFDGWSDTVFAAAVTETNVAWQTARLACPHGVRDLAILAHKRGDNEMSAQAQAQSARLAGLRYSERVAALVRLRLEAAGDAEVVRRSVTYFSLPQHGAVSASLIWGTADLIWAALGDTSRDVNWYTKRMTLSAVYSATLLYWLGDESQGKAATWAFLDRRIANVLQFEKLKGKFRSSPIGRAFECGPGRLLERISAPTGTATGVAGNKENRT